MKNYREKYIPKNAPESLRLILGLSKDPLQTQYEAINDGFFQKNTHNSFVNNGLRKI